MMPGRAQVMAALTASIVPMTNAFIIMFIVTSICAPAAPRARDPPRRGRLLVGACGGSAGAVAAGQNV